MYSAFGWCIHLNLNKLTLMTGFVVQGHSYMLQKCDCTCAQVICVYFFPVDYFRSTPLISSRLIFHWDRPQLDQLRCFLRCRFFSRIKILISRINPILNGLSGCTQMFLSLKFVSINIPTYVFHQYCKSLDNLEVNSGSQTFLQKVAYVATVYSMFSTDNWVVKWSMLR